MLGLEKSPTHWKDLGQIPLQRVREARRMKKGARESKGVREIVGMWEGGRGTEMGHRWGS